MMDPLYVRFPIPNGLLTVKYRSTAITVRQISEASPKVKNQKIYIQVIYTKDTDIFFPIHVIFSKLF